MDIHPPPAATALPLLWESVPAWLLHSLASLTALLLAGFFATLGSALQRSVPSRVLTRTTEEQRSRIEPLLSRADSLGLSATALTVFCELVFFGLVVMQLEEAGLKPGWRLLGTSLLIAVPLLLLVCEGLASAISASRGDRMLIALLPAFHRMQLPIGALVFVLEGLRRRFRRMLGMPDRHPLARQMLEVFREVIEDADIQGDLDETERKIIENVVEFHDVDVAEIMTPRTEIEAVELSGGLPAAVKAVAESGHSRIPVYEGNLDAIVGTVTARDVIQQVANGQLATADLRSLLRPTYFVPETKHVADLLAEFRREKVKIAIVLDEYGGTSGLVTMGDILTEIVGELNDEFDEDGPSPIKHLDTGEAEVEASERVSDVNEELGLDIPEEEDYETLAGFVLAELGHFPKRGESFSRGNAEYQVVDANDRRVLKVRIRRSVPQPSS